MGLGICSESILELVFFAAVPGVCDWVVELLRPAAVVVAFVAGGGGAVFWPRFWLFRPAAGGADKRIPDVHRERLP